MCLLLGQEAEQLLSRFFFGEDSYEITYLAEMLSSDQSCFAALPSKSSFFCPFHFSPIIPCFLFVGDLSLRRAQQNKKHIFFVRLCRL